MLREKLRLNLYGKRVVSEIRKFVHVYALDLGKLKQNFNIYTSLSVIPEVVINSIFLNGM